MVNIGFCASLKAKGDNFIYIPNKITHTTVKGISHVNEAVVNFYVGLVYRGNMRLDVNWLFPR